MSFDSQLMSCELWAGGEVQQSWSDTYFTDWWAAHRVGGLLNCECSDDKSFYGDRWVYFLLVCFRSISLHIKSYFTEWWAAHREEWRFTQLWMQWCKKFICGSDGGICKEIINMFSPWNWCCVVEHSCSIKYEITTDWFAHKEEDR